MSASDGFRRRLMTCWLIRWSAINSSGPFAETCEYSGRRIRRSVAPDTCRIDYHRRVKRLGFASEWLRTWTPQTVAPSQMSPVTSCAVNTIAMFSGIQHNGGGKAKGPRCHPGLYRTDERRVNGRFDDANCCGSMASARMPSSRRFTGANKGGLNARSSSGNVTDHPSVRRNGGRSVLKIWFSLMHSRAIPRL